MKVVLALTVLLFLGAQAAHTEDVIFPPVPPAEEEVLGSIRINIHSCFDNGFTELLVRDGRLVMRVAFHPDEPSDRVPEPPGTDPKSISLFRRIGREDEIGEYVTRSGDVQPRVPTYVTVCEQREILSLESHKWKIANDFTFREGSFELGDLGCESDPWVAGKTRGADIRTRVRISNVHYYSERTARWDEYYNNQLNAQHRRKYGLQRIAQVYRDSRKRLAYISPDGEEHALLFYRGKQMKDVHQDLRDRFVYADSEGNERVMRGLEKLINRDSLGTWVDVGFSYDVKFDQIEKGEHLDPLAKELVPPSHVIWKVGPSGSNGIFIWNYEPGEVLFDVDLRYEVYRVLEE